MKQRTVRNGYKAVSLSQNGKKYSRQVHRLVLMNFKPVPNMDKLEVNHNDEDKANNRLENLCWMTRAENVRYGTACYRAHEKTKRRIECIDSGAVYESLTDAAKQTGINIYNMSRCCNGYLKTAGGYRWRYI